MMEKYISNIKTPKISIAPMVDKSHRHFRYFSRLITKDALLYTEMATAQSIIKGDRDKILYFRKEEGPVALQIAASNPEDAYKAVKLAYDYNYSEINLNCGCPSDRVSGNLMGAALMSSKDLVYEILSAMKEATNKPITIKHRIGIDGTGVIDDPKS
ncbi:tRNA dihydrouridine(20/20a) synthase DusA, partial [Clostridium perfringens]